MCQFLSAIVRRNGDVLHSAETDSHEVLIKAHGLVDTPLNREWVRVELRPTMSTIPDDPKTWKLTVDETEVPHWWEEIKERVHNKLLTILNAAIERGKQKYVIGGLVIVAEGTIEVHSAVVHAYGGRVEAFGHSQCCMYGESDLIAHDNTVGYARGDSKFIAKDYSFIYADEWSHGTAADKSTVLIMSSCTKVVPYGINARIIYM